MYGNPHMFVFRKSTLVRSKKHDVKMGVPSTPCMITRGFIRFFVSCPKVHKEISLEVIGMCQGHFADLHGTAEMGWGMAIIVFSVWKGVEISEGLGSSLV
jgi:hypothetical protein